MDPAFWSERRVFLTGDTGFKGSWLTVWLTEMGARLTGFALPPDTRPSFFDSARLGGRIHHIDADIRDIHALSAAVNASEPEVVIHMAAQSLVRRSYADPVGTYATNVMGTVNLLEAVRHCPSVRVVLIVTSDKCYENREKADGYAEDDAMGGHDPYSSSKGCAELVTSAWRRSFSDSTTEPRAKIATARAGNVVGGGDWAEDRVVPDAIRSFIAGKPVLIRSPDAIRPWQHVLEPLNGYLLLCERLWRDGDDFADAWNFGPPVDDARPVSWVIEQLCSLWGEGADWTKDNRTHPHEAKTLRLDTAKAVRFLGWAPRWPLETALEKTIAWYRAHQTGSDIRAKSVEQIQQYMQAVSR